MKCPACGNLDSAVTDSRYTNGGNYIRRRRKCKACSHLYTTQEILAHEAELVRDSNNQIVGIEEATSQRAVELLTTLLKILCCARPATTRLQSAMRSVLEGDPRFSPIVATVDAQVKNLTKEQKEQLNTALAEIS